MGIYIYLSSNVNVTGVCIIGSDVNFLLCLFLILQQYQFYLGSTIVSLPPDHLHYSGMHFLE